MYVGNRVERGSAHWRYTPIKQACEGLTNGTCAQVIGAGVSIRRGSHAENYGWLDV